MPRVVPSQVVEFIEGFFPFSTTEDKCRNLSFGVGPKKASGLTAIVDLVQQVPHHLIALEGREYAALITGLAAVRNAVSWWQEGGHSPNLTYLSAFDNLNPVYLIRRALSTCPDEFPSPETAGLDFIPEQELRESVRTDISTANTALSNGEWKAATVMAGAAVEALLLWALQQRPPPDVWHAVETLVATGILDRNPGQNLERWNLHSYIEVAANLDLISPEAATQARLAKDFRNLIHPGLESRRGQTCDRGTALAALAAVEFVIRNLTP